MEHGHVLDRHYTSAMHSVNLNLGRKLFVHVQRSQALSDDV